MIDLERSKPDRIVLCLSFHHMDESGCYDGWTEHEAIVTPSLAFGVELRITGRNRNDIKTYLADLLHDDLMRAEYVPPPSSACYVEPRSATA